MRIVRDLLAASVAAGMLSGGAFAQTWPAKPVQIIHGLTAGSNPDLVARAMQPMLAERLGQSVVVDLKPGAAGRIATAYVAKAPPDGYTILMLNGGDGVMAATVKDLPYDLLADFTFVSTTTVFPFLITVGADSPYKSLPDLIADAKKRPGKLSYGHSGVASTLHLTGELLKLSAGIDMAHVPYKGNQVQDLGVGRLDAAVSAPTSSQPLIKAGKVRALAVTGPRRDPAFPDVATVGETLPGFEVTSWLGLAVPAKTPQPIVDRLAQEIATVLANPDVASRLRTSGSEPQSSSPAEFRARVESDIAKWKRVAAKIDLQ